MTNRLFKLSFAVLLPFLLFAHRVDIFTDIQNGQLEVWGYFSDGTPAKNADVKVYNSQGKLLFEGKTNKEGQLTWKLPQGVKSLKIVLYAGLGHKAEATLTVKNNIEPNQGESKTTSQQMGNSKSENPKPVTVHTLNPQSMEHTPWKKAFCGIGWILGIFGIWNFLYFRKKTKTKA